VMGLCLYILHPFSTESRRLPKSMGWFSSEALSKQRTDFRSRRTF